ncbi:hypothetical protein A8950_0545 [Dongia mobilis]|uniref:Histidine phosphatase superfamily protein (Branch 1) n=1 Tax=Dongia mobilis TaxID=578943 RepID=A0A4R6WUC8_9PROT|nr:hypothetical protein A8950_0545 [Dongia mobilis]
MPFPAATPAGDQTGTARSVWEQARQSVLPACRRTVLRVLIGCLAVGALTCAAAAIGNELDEAHAIASLRQGGYVVYLRHADRHKGPKEKLDRFSSPAEFADCSQQRNLNNRGRAQAWDIGVYMRRLGIVFDRVIANAQCRTRDTALLAFGRADLEPRVYDPAFVAQVLSSKPPAGSNTIVIGNDFQFLELTGIQLGRADAAVIRPDGAGGFAVLAKLELEDWREAADRPFLW